MKIPLPITTGLDWLNPVMEAELVDVAPHLPDATFAVHPCHAHQGWWTVTHVETGLCVCPDYRTKAMAIKKAAICLRDKTPAQYEEAVAEALTRAPWINASSEGQHHADPQR